MTWSVSPHTRIHLAGHRGLVGSAIRRALEARGHQNLILRTHAELDLTDRQKVRSLYTAEKPQAVILAAAKVGGILANWESPYEFIQENLAIEQTVIDEAFRAGVKHLLFLGSSCIYPREAPQPLKEEYLLTGPLEETNRPYALAKIAGIELCRSLNREYGTRYLSLMPTNLYGPGDNFDLRESHVLAALIRRFHEAKLGLSDEDGNSRQPHASVTLWGTGAPRREFLYADDAGEAICFLLERLLGGEDLPTNLPDGMINIGVGEDLTVSELARLVQRIVGHEGPVQWDTSMPDGTPQKLMDVSRINKLGWKPRVSLEEGVRRTYQWYCAAGS